LAPLLGGSSPAWRGRQRADDGGPESTCTPVALQEHRALLYGPVYRVLGTPVVAVLDLANTAIIVRETGEAVFGLVSLVATITLLFPFADLGIGCDGYVGVQTISRVYGPLSHTPRSNT
jgi:hypothetical protein